MVCREFHGWDGLAVGYAYELIRYCLDVRFRCGGFFQKQVWVAFEDSCDRIDLFGVEAAFASQLRVVGVASDAGCLA